MTSSVPQGSVLRPTLFIIYINDLVETVTNRTILYADYTKILIPIDNSTDAERLQIDINSIVEWTNKWLMKLNIEKCKVMHFGKHNTRHKYTIDSYTTNTPIPLATSEVERHLGIQLKVYLKVSHQCKTAANRANFQLIVLKIKFI